MQITRKEFLGRMIKGAAGIAGVAMVVGCSSSSGGTDPDASTSALDAAHAVSCAMNGTVSTVAANHGHVLVVSKADVAAGAAKTYDIQGTANHPHTVNVTAAMFAMLQGNTAIAMTSSLDANHTHTVTVMCA